MSRLDPEIVELFRPSPHACIEGGKRIQMLEELAEEVQAYLADDCPDRHRNLVAASARIDQDNERVDRMNREYDVSVEKLEAEPNGGWVQFNE